MILLALDSSGLVASTAIATEERILAEYTTNYKKTHSQTLLPMIAEITKMTETDLSTITAVAVTAGPGSFTGLRIGSATAKGLAQALGKPIISVPTTLALAWNFAGEDAVICPLMDARRAQVYTGLYSRDPETGMPKSLLGQVAVPVEEIIERVNEIGRPVVYLGDGTDVYKDILKEKTKVPYRIAATHQNRQSAASLAACAFSWLHEKQLTDAQAVEEAAKANKTVSESEVSVTDAASFVPIYLRKSQAEREREEQIGQENA